MLRNKTFAPEFCSLISNWFDMREQAPGANLLHESVSGASSLVCTEICLPWHDVSPVGQSNWFNWIQSGCFIIQLPRRVLRVYWLGYLPGSVLQEQAPSCVPALSIVRALLMRSCQASTHSPFAVSHGTPWWMRGRRPLGSKPSPSTHLMHYTIAFKMRQNCEHLLMVC